MVVLLSRIQFALWVDFQGLRHSRMWICSIGGIRVRNSSMPGQPNAEGFRFCKLRGRGSPVSMRADSGTGIRTVGRMSRPFAVPHSSSVERRLRGAYLEEPPGRLSQTAQMGNRRVKHIDAQIEQEGSCWTLWS